MNDEKVKGRLQEASERVHNFQEVEFGFNDEEALKEASRCLQCVKPRCMEGCPVSIEIPKFIKAIKDGNLKEAYEIITNSSSLPAVCGRVCPQEKQCEAKCVKGLKGDAISIGSLERYVADQAILNGFASVSLTYGIPEFRLPKSIVQKEVDSLKNLGVNILCDVPVGNAITIPDLQKEYDAVFLGTGAGLPKFMGIEGENANQVFSANEILTRINLMGAYQDESKTPIKRGKKAYVIGGGNVAMDAVRSLKRLGVDAHIMYRRSDEELPARRMEVEHARDEGIVFDMLTNPVRILTDENNNVTGMEVVNMILGEAGEDGRRSVTEDKDSLHTVECDMVVMALGTSPNHGALKMSNIELSDRGLIVVEGSHTSLDNVYAGGDAVTGAATVILAMEAGKKAAREIMEKIG